MPAVAPRALAFAAARRYSSASVRCSHRLAAQDVALSRRKQGFESPWERQWFQRIIGHFTRVPNFYGKRAPGQASDTRASREPLASAAVRRRTGQSRRILRLNHSPSRLSEDIGNLRCRPFPAARYRNAPRSTFRRSCEAGGPRPSENTLGFAPDDGDGGAEWGLSFAASTRGDPEHRRPGHKRKRALPARAPPPNGTKWTSRRNPPRNWLASRGPGPVEPSGFQQSPFANRGNARAILARSG